MFYERASNGAGGGELLLDATEDSLRLVERTAGSCCTSRSTRRLVPISGCFRWSETESRRSFLGTASNEPWGQFSPDGRWVAYQSNESGRFEIYVRPFPGPGGRATVSTSGGIHPRWSRDGKELFFLAPDGTLTSARIVVTGQTIEAGVPVALFQTRIVGGGGNLAGYRQQYDVAPDGRFLINVGLESDPPPITLLSNWKPRE